MTPSVTHFTASDRDLKKKKNISTTRCQKCVHIVVANCRPWAEFTSQNRGPALLHELSLTSAWPW